MTLLRVLIWRYVLKQLMKYKMLSGSYDATNGSSAFMYGIMTVMEIIADRADKYEEFENMFVTNMIMSENKSEI